MTPEAALLLLATSDATLFVFLRRNGTVKEAEKQEFSLSGCNNPPFLRFSRYSSLFTVATNDADGGMNK